MHRNQSQLIIRAKGHTTRDHLVEQHTQRIEVATRVGPAMHLKKFRCDIIDRAKYIAGAGQLRGFGRNARNAEVG